MGQNVGRQTLMRRVECAASPTGVHDTGLVLDFALADIARAGQGPRIGVTCACEAAGTAPIAQTLAAAGQPTCWGAVQRARQVMAGKVRRPDLSTVADPWGAVLARMGGLAQEVRERRQKRPRTTRTMDERFSDMLQNTMLAALERVDAQHRPGGVRRKNVERLVWGFAFVRGYIATLMGDCFVEWQARGPSDAHFVDVVIRAPEGAGRTPWMLWVDRGYCVACARTFAKPGAHTNSRSHQMQVARIVKRAWGRLRFGEPRRWMLGAKLVGTEGRL